MTRRALAGPSWRPARRVHPRLLFPLLLLTAALACLPAGVWPADAEGAGEYAFVLGWTWPQQRHEFSLPQGVAVGPDGSVYVADTGADRIQRLTAEGWDATSWGSPGTGPGQFDEPQDVAVGPDGSVYVVDTSNNRVQKFDPAGTYLTAWDGSAGSAGAFAGPCGIAVDQDGYVYVADTSNDRIQKFSGSGVFVASWGESGSANGEFSFPIDVAIGQNGYVYVTDRYNDRVQRFTTTGTYLSSWGGYGSTNGLFMGLGSVAVGADGSVYVTDKNSSRVQKFTATGGYLTKWGSAGDGDGQFAWSDVFGQVGIAVSSAGVVYVVDPGNDRLLPFTTGGGNLAAWDVRYGSRYALTTAYDEFGRPTHTVDRQGSLWDLFEYDGARLTRKTLYRGGDYRDIGFTEYFMNGSVTWKAVHQPSGEYAQRDREEDIAVGPDGTVYVVDSNRLGIERGTSAGESVERWTSVWTLAVAADDDGFVYAVDRRWVTDYDQYGNALPTHTLYRIAKLDAGGAAVTQWQLDFTDSSTSDAGLAVDDAGYVYLALTARNRVYKFAPGGGGSVADWGGTGSANGQFSGPYGIAVDDAGHVYVSDTGNDRIQKFSTAGAYLAKWGTAGSADGAFDAPGRVAVAADGSVFVADSGNHRIQKFDANGGFLAKWGGQGDGEGEFETPHSVAVGPDGAVYVVDTGNGRRVQKFALSADSTPPTTGDDYDDQWHATAVTVHLTPVDAGGSGMSGGLAKTEYSKDGGATWIEGTSVTYAVWKRGGGSGLHTLLYRSSDAAGNLEVAKSVEVKIDARRPPTTSDDAPSTPHAGPVSVHLTAVDSLLGVSACSGVASVTYRLDGGAPQTVAGAAATVAVSGVGLHTIVYYSVDNAGNVESLRSCTVTILSAAAARRVTRGSVSRR